MEELLLEARKGNKEAFKALTEDLEIKMYKTARCYFTLEDDVIHVMKISMKHLFKEIVNVRKEEQLLPLAMKFLIKHCEEIYLKKSRNTKWLDYLEDDDNIKAIEYRDYRANSITEECITSLTKDLRLISVLYYYDGLEVQQIANLLKKSSRDVEAILDKARIRLFEIISDEGTKKYNDYVK